MDDRAERLVWLDMEMTGLDPASCVPIEVAVIITSGTLEEIPGATYEAVIHQPPEALANMIPLVVEMHTANGLLERVRTSEIELEQADSGLAGLISAHCVAHKAVLAGNSISQDRRFIRRYFPKTEALLHYRQVDVSSFKEMVRRWYPEAPEVPKETAHTAMADIRASLNELAYYRDHFFKKNG